jgi:hypothetical protein
MTIVALDEGIGDKYLEGLEMGLEIAQTNGAFDYIPALFYPNSEWELGFYTGYWSIKGK